MRPKLSARAVVDALLVGLRECETKTRWSAAKGIGRIASRLPRSIADDVVEGVLSVFDDQGSHDDDNAWHGSCLALAELSRLGVLLPSRLSAAFSALSAALKYDRQRGNHSIGLHNHILEDATVAYLRSGGNLCAT